MGRAAAIKSVPLLGGNIDPYNGVAFLVDAADVEDPRTFRLRLQSSLVAWRSEGRRGIWAKVPTAAASLLPTLLAEGFDWHHARPEGQQGGGYVMLVLWLPKDEHNTLPLYASHQVGVGGLVFNEAGEVLLMKERFSVNAKVHDLWKIPGGLTNLGENLVDCAEREVKEETGICATAEGLLCVHHRHGVAHGISDLYFTVRMKAKTTELQADPNEVSDLTWMPLEMALTDPEVMFFNRRILALANQPVLLPHLGTHGATRGVDFYLYAAKEMLNEEE